MEIKIAFSRPKHPILGINFISKFIKKDYSHVLVHWNSESLERNLVYQASKSSVHFIELNNFLKDNIIVKEYVIDICENRFKRLVQKCVDLAGQKYSYSQLFTLFIHECLAKLNITMNIKDQKGYICSELLATLLEEIFDVQFSMAHYLVKPNDIEDFLQKNIKLTTIE